MNLPQGLAIFTADDFENLDQMELDQVELDQVKGSKLKSLQKKRPTTINSHLHVQTELR